MSTEHPDEPCVPNLYILRLPRVLGSAAMTYAPRTIATSAGDCWDKALEWADDVYVMEQGYMQLNKTIGRAVSAISKRAADGWAAYKPDAPRALRIAWLKRQGCRVVAGHFIPKEPTK